MKFSLFNDELDQFAEEMLAIRNAANESLSKKDYQHLRKVIWLNRILLLVGFATAWIIPNPISMFSMGIALSGMWAIVAHHVLHGGYDKISNIPKRYHSHLFANGWRRIIDWPDWIFPPAWKYEHNILHHFFTNEVLDPDQPSYRLAAKTSVLSQQKSKLFKIIQLIVKISTWKCSYYAFNTMKAYMEKKSYQQDGNFKKYRSITYRHCILPYISFHFILLPMLFLPLGWRACLFVLINRLGAELITNWHTFFIIVTNHTSSDLALQDKHFTTKGEFYISQIMSSCNFNTGGFWRDYLQGYLNYQIEHHLFPNLPASHYPKLQPLVKSLCLKYKIPYIQEPIFKRVKKLFCILTEKETMSSNKLEVKVAQQVERDLT